MFNLPLSCHFYFPPPPQFYYFPSSIFSFPPPQFQNFNIFPPPAPHFYCFPSSSSFLLFSHQHHHHISIVFAPPPPPPPHFYCFFKSQTSLTLLLRHYELSNENVSYFLTNQSKTKTFIDLKVTRKPKPTKNSTGPYLNEIPAHFIHDIKTIAYEVT